MWRRIKSMIFREMECESNLGSSSESPTSMNKTDTYDEMRPNNGKRKQDLLDAEDLKKRKSGIPVFTEQCKALGKLDFPKMFLVLNLVSPHALEHIFSPQDIQNLQELEISDIERNTRQAMARTVDPTCFSEEKRYEWNPNSRHEYHCYVDRDGNCTLKGPFPLDTTTILHRVLGDSNVLQVHFEERLGYEQLEASGRVKDELYKENGQPKMFCDWAKEGIFVGLRRYKFFVFKDSGKQKSIKCYFVCNQSFAEVDINSAYTLFDKSIHEARCMFMHAHTVSSLKKYMMRFSLILSNTKSFGDISDVVIKHIKDIPCMDENQNETKDINGEALVQTDGTGFISEDLASHCALKIYQGKHFDKDCKVCPLLIQCRLFYDGYAVKGTLLVNRTLPPKTINVRKSMIKVKKDSLLSCSSVKSFEICKTSCKPKRSFLSRNLIALLSYGGVPDEIFVGLVYEAFDCIQNKLSDRTKAFKVIKECRSEDYTVLRMLSCGIPLYEPLLQYKLREYMLAEEIKKLKKGKIPIDESFYLMGTADPTGQLKRNEVCIILDHGQVSGKVLVYRNPGLHFGDIHVLKAVYVEEIEKIVGDSKYAIFFSTQGPRSVADEIAKGDFDGDLYWVSMNAKLLEHFKPEMAWERTLQEEGKQQPRPNDFSYEKLEAKLIEEFFDQCFAPSNPIGVAADSLLAFMDRLLTPQVTDPSERRTLKEKMNRLTNLYYDALVAKKTGIKVNIPRELVSKKKPHFLKEERQDNSMTPYYQSSSILGKIYDLTLSDIHSRSDEIWTIPCFWDTNATEFKARWKEHYDDYKFEMTNALKSNNLLKRGENATGVIQKYKQILYGATTPRDSPKPKQQIHLEASAIYQVVYEHAQQVKKIKRCHFAWRVAGEALCEMYLENQKQENIRVSPSILYENIS